jgi:uncharacterized membrane-anchored protein YitT (DUF2179 family)
VSKKTAVNSPRDMNTMHTAKRLALIIAGSIILAFNINTFVSAGSLIPGGLTGLTLLLQECGKRYLNISLPFSPILFILNAVPAFISFRFIGKRFSLYSCLSIILTGLFTDFMPHMFIELIQLHNTLLSAVFGGILCAAGVSLCLHSGATSGGTDFIAIFISEKYRRNAWNYIFIGNCVLLAVAGAVFSLEQALYSIIFQYTTTMGINAFYKAYRQVTLFIITSKPDDVYTLIRDRTHHAATAFTGKGQYEKSDRVMLYSVVSANEADSLIAKIKLLDPVAFINVIRTEQLGGRFYRRPKD